MRYWDASAIVPLLVRQERTDELLRLLEVDAAMIAWWGTPLECCSALMRLVRERALTEPAARQAERRLGELRSIWSEVLPTQACRQAAERMLRVHPLRTADALQLAAALMAADYDTARFELVCLDRRLAEAAGREGFTLSVTA